MQPVTASTPIDRPPEEVFEYLADIANHPEFMDHFLTEWRLTRIDSYGRGAGARFRTKRRGRRFGWADLTLVELDPPFRIVAVGRGGKYNRVRTFAEWRLSPASGGTEVEFTFETEPALLSDRILEPLGGRGWFKRKSAKAMQRLRRILEENAEPPTRGRRATVAGL